NIGALSFVDFQGQHRTYLNNGNMLLRLMYDGNVKWHRIITQNLYDGSLIYHERFISESGKPLDVVLNMKKKLRELTIAKPELSREIDELQKGEEAILAILKKYDSD